MFLVSLSDLEEAESHTVTLDDHPLLREYADVFPDEIPGMPPQRDIDFRIDPLFEARTLESKLKDEQMEAKSNHLINSKGKNEKGTSQ
ncbi:hypothetical protein P3S38_27810 [Enterobacter hormaechei]|uniref:hypothetical protein n=1 Tax=Enterobacter hormaechei TaxID=158836 RepID=UPI0023E43A89|nr:hypothetical protein [Enterobacter hormaechei]MDF3680789.1 hypothetical protein [Enterobacter hormaechei]